MEKGSAIPKGSRAVAVAQARLEASKKRLAEAEAVLEQARRASQESDRKRDAARKIVLGALVMSWSRTSHKMARYLSKVLPCEIELARERDAALLREVAMQAEADLVEHARVSGETKTDQNNAA